MTVLRLSRYSLTIQLHCTMMNLCIEQMVALEAQKDNNCKPASNPSERSHSMALLSLQESVTNQGYTLTSYG